MGTTPLSFFQNALCYLTTLTYAELLVYHCLYFTNHLFTPQHAFPCLFVYQVVWLKEFKHIENTSSPIDPVTSVDEDLATTIRKYIVPGQKLAVGKPEYKRITEDKLEISCLYGDAVMELMWGLKYSIQYLVPSEKLELTKDDRLRMSTGMKIVLESFDLKVEPEMVNEHIIEAAGVVYCCDHSVNKHAKSLRAAGEHLKKISNIDSQNWCLLKLASAPKIICYPGDEIPGIPLEVFSAEEYSKLMEDGP